jgi:lipopolysaccharide transport system permease protein
VADDDFRALPRLWWQQRWLLGGFIDRELRGRYVGSLGGIAWVFVHPLILLAIYTMVFQVIFRVRLPELERYPFVAFAALGLWPWLAFQEGLQRATQAIKANAALVRKVAFQQELLVFAATLSAFVVHMTGYLLALALLSVFGIGIRWSGLPAVAALMASLFLFTLAAGLCLAALQVFIPDMEQILGPALAVLFYATPILYPLTAVPDWLRQAMAFNPLLHFVEPMRAALLDGAAVSPAGSPGVWLATPLLLVPALWFFRRLSPYFEDFI